METETPEIMDPKVPIEARETIEAGIEPVTEEKVVEQAAVEPVEASNNVENKSDTAVSNPDEKLENKEVASLAESEKKDSVEDSTPKVTEMVSETADVTEMVTDSGSDMNTAEPTSMVKEEPTDVEMELAEDFTRKSADFPTVPRVTVKQEVPDSYNAEVARERAAESRAVVQIANSSLSLLAQYISSESDISDSDEELPRKTANPTNDTSTTASATATRQESSSSDESSDDDVQIIPNTTNYRSNQDMAIVVSDTETNATGMDENDFDHDADSSSDEGPVNAAPIRTAGEVLLHELPPIEDLHIEVPESQCKPVGQVQSIVAQIVIVQSYAGVELLNLDTVLFLDKGKRPLGKIFDVIGQVTAPMYCVLFNSRQDVAAKGITVGTLVYCAPQTEHTSFIILSDLMRYKGSDASWKDDNEVPEHAREFSDDEEERRARRRRNSHSSDHHQPQDGHHGQRNSFGSSDGRQTPEGGSGDGRRPFYHRRGGGGRGGRGFHRGGRRGHSWHHNIPAHMQQQYQPQQQHYQQQQMNQPQRVLNPFALAAGLPPPPPPPHQGN